MPPKKSKCGICSKQVSDDDNGIQCEICGFWFHDRCQDMSESLYKFVNTYAKDVHWYCKVCNKGADKILAIVTKLQGKMDKVEEEICRLQSESREAERNLSMKLEVTNKELRKEIDGALTQISGNFSSQIENTKAEIFCIMDQKMEELEKKWNEIGKKDEEKPPHLWSDVVKEMEEKVQNIKVDMSGVQKNVEESKRRADEQKDKDNRANNIVIYNAVEDRTENKEEWYKRERTFCHQLFNNVLKVEVKMEDIKRVIRLGKQSDSSKRPMLVEMRSRILKNQIMESLRNLRDAVEPYQGLVICHDMTKAERENCRKLVVEAKEREAKEGQGEWIFRVRGTPDRMIIVKLAARK